VGGNPELVLPEHQHSHLFESNNVVELADCMALYIKNPERYQEDSALVKKHCQNNFSLDSMVQKYHRLYQLVRNKDLI
jgi:glycosyltransferase involved in cell wall biosynthesis